MTRPGHTPGDNKQRDAQIYARYLNGETRDALGAAFSVTGERVRQIIRQGEHEARRLWDKVDKL